MELSTIVAAFSIIGGIIGMLKIAWNIFKYVVENIVKPLSNTVTQLQEAMKDLRELIDSVRKDQQALDQRITIVEQSTKSAHHRLDELWDCFKKNMGTIPDRRR